MQEITKYLIKPTVNKLGEVKAWEEKIMLPTYETGENEKNPMFLEKRVYQGSSGVVYPYPVIEKIKDEKIEKPYRAVFLENYYLKIMILPELGGRLQMGYDKIKKRHFVYYNQVIKPALVGLTGPWISGGIEFNWPQHHRPSTFLPTESLIEENEDGSVTVWCSEVERMFRTKGMQGFTLYPDKAYVKIKVKVYNRTNFPQTFLWWANPAVVVHDYYKSVFRLIFMRFSITANAKFLRSRLLPERIISTIIRQALIFQNIKTFLFLLPIWRFYLNLILWEVMRTMYKPDYYMWPTITYHPEKNNGPGAVETLGRPGTGTLRMRTVLI